MTKKTLPPLEVLTTIRIWSVLGGLLQTHEVHPMLSFFSSRFVFESLPGGFFIRLPFIGQLTVAPDGGTCFDPWRVIKATGEVR